MPESSMRGRGWKYGSGFVDGVFPVLSSMGAIGSNISEFVRREQMLLKSGSICITLLLHATFFMIFLMLLSNSVRTKNGIQSYQSVSVRGYAARRHEPDVYAYNASMEAYSHAGFLEGAPEISLMRHIWCEPNRASCNILIDAYGRASLHEDAEAAS